MSKTYPRNRVSVTTKMKNSNFKNWVTIYLMIASVSLAPMICALTAGEVASLIGCRLNEGGTDCPMGDLLYSMFVLGWLGLVTIPLGAILFVGAIIVNIFVYVTRVRD